MPEETTSIRTSFLIVTLLSLVWLAYATWGLLHEGARIGNLFDFLQAFAVILTPVAALYALASALGNRERLPTLREPDTLEETESRLAGVTSRIEALRGLLGTELESLGTVSATLDAQAAATRQLVQDLASATGAAGEAARTLEAILPAATAATETLHQALAETARNAEAQADRSGAAAGVLAQHLAALSEQGAAAAASLAQARTQSESGMRAIRGEADSLFEMLENTLVAKRKAVLQQGEAMAQQLADSYGRLEAMANTSTEGLSARLEALGTRAEAIEGRLKSQASMTKSLVTSGERAFQLLDARLAHSSETSRTTLERLSANVQEIGSELARLSQPLRDTRGATQELQGAVGMLKETALQTVDVLVQVIPERSVSASKAAETLAGDLGALVNAIEAAHGRAQALAEPIASSRAALDEAGRAYTSQREAIEAAGVTLVAELQRARTLIGEVEEQTRDTSLTAATRLVEAMARVRDVTSQTTGTMREMLDGLLAEAQESLSAAADEAMRKSFVEPIARHAREAEAAAAAAAERTAGSMAALANTLKLIEDRTSDRVTKLEEAHQSDILAAASLLTDELARSSVSIASALGRPMDDNDWALWRKGERGLFSRRAHALLDKHEARELKLLLDGDDGFARSAREYTAAFEALAQRFEGQAPGLVSALRGSEQGRLAAALSEVLEG